MQSGPFKKYTAEVGLPITTTTEYVHGGWWHTLCSRSADDREVMTSPICTPACAGTMAAGSTSGRSALGVKGLGWGGQSAPLIFSLFLFAFLLDFRERCGLGCAFVLEQWAASNHAQHAETCGGASTLFYFWGGYPRRHPPHQFLMDIV